MLKATLREYMGTAEHSKRVINLDRTQGDITFGRSDSCTYQIGKSLGKSGEGISRVQATIEFKPDSIVLVDGSRKERSTNRVWVHGTPIDDEITLYPGLDLTLFKAGGKVSLLINDPDTDGDRGSDTITGQDLLGVLQDQITLLQEQNQQIQVQVKLLAEQLAHREAIDNNLAEQLAHREAIDNNQEQRLLRTEKRLNRALAIVLSVIAAIVLASGWVGGSSEDKKLWSSTLQAIAIGVAAAYFKKQEDRQNVVKPQPP